MILNQETNDVLIFGEDNSKKAKISEDKLAKLQYLLTKGLYKDPISAVITEWTNNGIDGVVQAGKNPVENPVIVSISTNGNKTKFSVKDNGIGLSKSDFEDICMNYLESTKENDNDTIGHFGLGMKSFLSLERPATFTCIKDGWKRVYLVYEGSEFVNYDLIAEEEFEGESGVECSIDILDYNEKQSFIAKAKQKLAYYDTAVLIVDGYIIENTITRNEIFQISSMNSYNELHICLKDVVYKIDWDALGIGRIELPIALRFGLDSGLKPTPSRESYITNQHTKDIILKKIEEFSDNLVEKYNESVPDEIDFLSAYDKIDNNNYTVSINDRNYRINSITKYSDKKVKNFNVVGLKTNSPSYYKNYIYLLNRIYRTVVNYDRWGTWRNKRIYGKSFTDCLISNKSGVVLVDELPIGRIKSFFMEKYPHDTSFIIKDKMNLKDYIETFNLKRSEKYKWRATIQDWQHIMSLLESKCKIEKNVANSQEFLDYLDKKVQERKEWRKNNPQVKTVNSLNKQEGDITLAISRRGVGNKIVFDKKAYPINKLHKNKMYVVYGTEENKEMLTELFKISNQPIGYQLKTAIFKTCIIGKRELTKLPKINNFISMEKFMSEGNKKFRQIATAQLITETIDSYQKFRKNLTLNKYLKSVDDDIKILSEYVNKHPYKIDNASIYQAIMSIATENNYWDYSIYHVIKRVQENNELLNFAKFLIVPDNRSTDTMKNEYSRIVNQFILFNKLHKGKLENFELVEKIPVPIVEESKQLKESLEEEFLKQSII